MVFFFYKLKGTFVIAFILNCFSYISQHLFYLNYQDFLADYGMVWVGDDDADSDYDVLEETPSSVSSSLSRQQQVWNPSKTDRFILTLSYQNFIKSASPQLFQ